MMRKLAVTACVALTLILTGCVGPFSYGDGKRIRIAVEGLFGELERADYAAAASHWCDADGPSASQLREDFDGIARPWKIKLVSSSHDTGGTGFANLTLTDGARAERDYNVDFTLAGGTVEVCGVDTGTIHIDVDV